MIIQIFEDKCLTVLNNKEEQMEEGDWHKLLGRIVRLAMPKLLRKRLVSPGSSGVFHETIHELLTLGLV